MQRWFPVFSVAVLLAVLGSFPLRADVLYVDATTGNTVGAVSQGADWFSGNDGVLSGGSLVDGQR